MKHILELALKKLQESGFLTNDFKCSDCNQGSFQSIFDFNFFHENMVFKLDEQGNIKHMGEDNTENGSILIVCSNCMEEYSFYIDLDENFNLFIKE